MYKGDGASTSLHGFLRRAAAGLLLDRLPADLYSSRASVVCRWLARHPGNQDLYS